MALGSWGRPIATAIGVAAGAGAAQLGLGYGFGVVTWLPASAGAGDVAWTASLVWATWIAANSTVIGAVCARRLHEGRAERPPPRGTGTSRPATAVDAPASRNPFGAALSHISVALAAAVGALVTVALVAVPARTAAGVGAGADSPPALAAAYAAMGVALGLLVACWAAASRAVAANVVATAWWVWLTAIVTAAATIASGQELAGVQLAVFTSDSERFWFRDYFYWPGAAVSLGAALVIGAVAARRAARCPQTRVGGAVSGLVGPLLIAGAYFLTAPRLAEINAEQLSAHLMAPYLTLAGLAGSALVTARAQRAGSGLPVQGGSATTVPAAALPAARTAVIPAQATGEPGGKAGPDRPGGDKRLKDKPVKDKPVKMQRANDDPAGDKAVAEKTDAEGSPEAAPQKRARRFGWRR